MNCEVRQVHFLAATDYCDAESHVIRQAATNVTRHCKSEAEVAQSIYYWVRDSIRYQLGLCGDRASETLIKGAGSCVNKANLAVALFRACGIPSAFHLMEVRARQYLGVFATPRFNQFMSERSLHVYCGALLAGRWVKLDPADDIQLSYALQHLCRQATVVDFDGHTDARLNLAPEDIISDDGRLVPSVDHVLSKERRLDANVMRVFNLYIEYLRRHCIWTNAVDELENGFMAWLGRCEPELSTIFNRFSQRAATPLTENRPAALAG